MKLTALLLPTVALGAAAALLIPIQESDGYSTIGGSLSTDQRDYRVFNNFADSTANNNTVADSQFPGYDGAEMAFWKAFVEWGSGLHGTGGGDATQPNDIGSGGANFDPTWQGNALGVGNTNDNINSAISSCGGGTLAFTETPISNGWRIRFCDNWTWSDGPGVAFGLQFDIQGVATHEFGHALGLGHSFSGTVMQPSTASGNDTRDLAVDDQNGVQFIYGVKSGTKPNITGVSVAGTSVTITGSNFATTGNEVWFTNKTTTATGSDPRARVLGASSTGGGTSITVTAPGDAGPGDVLVKIPGSNTGAFLSNAYPVDVTGVGGSGLEITSITPSTVDALIPGTAQTISINGLDFTPTTTVSVDGVLQGGFPSNYTFVSSNLITLDMPQLDFLGAVDIEVDDGSTTDSAQITVVAPSSPVLQVGTGDIGNSVFSASGIPFIVSGTPGNIHLVIYSKSNVPSLSSFVNLDLGNNFAQVPYLNPFVIDPTKAWDDRTLTPASVPAFTTFYFQSVDVTTGSFPLDVSNLQEILIIF